MERSIGNYVQESKYFSGAFYKIFHQILCQKAFCFRQQFSRCLSSCLRELDTSPYAFPLACMSMRIMAYKVHQIHESLFSLSCLYIFHGCILAKLLGLTYCLINQTKIWHCNLEHHSRLPLHPLPQVLSIVKKVSYCDFSPSLKVKRGLEL